MKKVVSLCLVILMLMAMAGCTPDDNSGTQSPGNADTTAPENQNKEVSISETVLLNADGVKITAKSFTYFMFRPTVELLIENNSGKNLTVEARNSSINGYMVRNMMSVDVADGEKVNDALIFKSIDFEKTGIEAIAEMEFSFHISTTEDGETYLDSDPVILKTSIADSYQQVHDTTGELVYDADGIKIIIKGLSEEEDLLDPEMIVYLENTGSKNIIVQTLDDVSVNGFMIHAVLSCKVNAGKRAIAGITFMESSLEENSIEKIESVEVSFTIIDADSGDTIAKTQTITITF